LTFKLKVGRKGYIILPKAIMEAVGIEEGDEVIVEIRDGILLKPVKKVDVKSLRRRFKTHLDRIRNINDRKEIKPRDLEKVSKEEEFMK